MDIFVEINFFDTSEGIAYSAVLDSDGEPVVLCDGVAGNRKEALQAIFNTLQMTIK